MSRHREECEQDEGLRKQRCPAVWECVQHRLNLEGEFRGLECQERG